MPELERIEREYRILSARISYAEAQNQPVSEVDRKRLGDLETKRVRLTAPDFSKLLAAS